MISEEEFKKLRVQKFVFNNDTNYVDIDDFVKGVKDFKRDKRNKIIFLEKADMAQVFWDYLTKKLKLEHVYRGQI
jgi:CRISPR/Cas system-associated endoribonuclease Cas2